MKTILSVLFMLIMGVLHADNPDIRDIRVIKDNPAFAENLIINVRSSDSVIRVSLPANPSTGYQWSIKSYDRILLEFYSRKYDPPLARFMGAGGKMNYLFKLVRGTKVPKSTTLVFIYSRSWEPLEEGIVKTVVIRFNTNQEFER